MKKKILRILESFTVFDINERLFINPNDYDTIVGRIMEEFIKIKDHNIMKNRDKILRKAKRKFTLGTEYIDNYGNTQTVKDKLEYYHYTVDRDHITDGYGGFVWDEHTGFAKIIKSKEDKILSKAKKKYPLGTEYINRYGAVAMVEGELRYHCDITSYSITDGCGGSVWDIKLGFAKIVMSKKDRVLRKAKKMYPIGTIYVNKHGINTKVKGELEYYCYHDYVNVGDGITDGHGGYVWDEKTGFAKIVSKPFIVGSGGISGKDAAEAFRKAMLKFNITNLKIKLGEEFDKLLNDI